MKQLLAAFFFLLGSSYALATENNTVDNVKNAVSSFISTGKDVLAGTAQGIDEGRKSGESVDGAYIIADKEGVAARLDVSIRGVEKTGTQTYRVTLVLRNTSDQTVRLINLNQDKALVLLDNDDFFSLPSGLLSVDERSVTIPEKSATRVSYVFGDVEGTPATLRIYGQAFDLTNIERTNP